MPKHYSQNHGSSILNARLDRFKDVEDELNVREELAVMRSVAFDKVEQYSTALEKSDPASINVYGEMASEHAAKVIGAAERIGKHEKTVREHITPEHLQFMATQLFNLAYELFGEADVTVAFVAQAEMILTGAHTASDIKDEDILELMGGTIPLLAPADMEALTCPVSATVEESGARAQGAG